MGDDGVVDITILGAGPAGLAAAYYAGHRDASVRIIESLEQLGGQVAAVYPEKHVYDVAGHPKILGTKLVELCAEQGLQYGAEVRLGEEVQTLERVSENGEELLAIGTTGGPFLTRALIITAGHGAFEPRKLGVDGIDEWEGRGLHYFVREKDVFRDRPASSSAAATRRSTGRSASRTPPSRRSRSSTGATTSARSSRRSARRARSKARAA